MADRSDQPASLPRRIAAAVIDGIVIVLIGGVAWLAIPGRQDLDIRATATVYAAVGALYEVLLIARFGQTAGKAVVGIAIVDASNGHPSIGRSALRYLLKSLQPLGVLSRWVGTPSPIASAFVVTGWQLVLLASIVSNVHRRGMHDRIARTVVVNVTHRPPFSERVSGRGLQAALTIQPSERQSTPTEDTAPDLGLVTYENSAFGRYRKRRLPKRR